MLNIISPLASSSNITGPMKVLTNTIKGLKLIGYPYILNRSLNSTERLWIQNGRDTLPFINRSRAKVIIGPNTAVLPSDLDSYHFPNAIYLQPSKWAVDFWRYLGFNKCALQSWAVGIDTEVFHPTNSSSQKHVMIYYKKRSLSELNFIMKTLSSNNISFVLVPYGNYSQSEYLELLATTSFIVWLGRHESQGIALQEAMSCNIPILVWDVRSLSQAKYEKQNFDDSHSDFPVTSVPYFNDQCGIVISDINNFNPALEEMLDSWRSFSPRSFILNNLSLEGQARELIDMWGYWDMTFEHGIDESPKSLDQFKIPKTYLLMNKLRRVLSNVQNK